LPANGPLIILAHSAANRLVCGTLVFHSLKE
jgi:hypothetical protein